MPGGFNQSDAQRINKTVVAHERGQRRTRPGNNPLFLDAVEVVEGILNEGLPAATSGNPGRAELAVYRGRGDQWKDTGETVEIVNRDSTMSKSGGDYLWAISINGEWRPNWGC